MTARLPPALENGEPIVRRIRDEFHIGTRAPGRGDVVRLNYPAISTDQRDARLTVRDRESDSRTEIPAGSWELWTRNRSDCSQPVPTLSRTRFTTSGMKPRGPRFALLRVLGDHFADGALREHLRAEACWDCNRAVAAKAARRHPASRGHNSFVLGGTRGMIVAANRRSVVTSVSRRSILIGLLPMVVVAVNQTVAAENVPWVAEKRLALSGYDPVSYFTEGQPEKGSVEYTASYDDAVYWFRSAEHRTIFLNDPDHYAPQFRGYCTNTVSKGDKHEADPAAWAIAGGKLYVFGSQKSLTRFRQETASVIEKATENWAKMRDSQ
jgi:YHS domain-containing protein